MGSFAVVFKNRQLSMITGILLLLFIELVLNYYRYHHCLLKKQKTKSYICI